MYPGIGFSSTSIFTHPLNNYDINYTTGIPVVFYQVTYNANGGTGGHVGPLIPSGSTDTVLSLKDTGINHEYFYTFTGWNTQANGDGTVYAPDDDIILTSDVTLYAMWRINDYTVAFESNEGTLVDSITGVEHGSTIIKPENPTKEGHIFVGWYTDDNTFENEWDFDTDTVIKDITLYAQWTEISELKEPEGPLIPKAPIASTKPKPPTTGMDNPKTGDNNSMVVLWISVLCLSQAVIVILRIRRGKKV